MHVANPDGLEPNWAEQTAEHAFNCLQINTRTRRIQQERMKALQLRARGLIHLGALRSMMFSEVLQATTDKL